MKKPTDTTQIYFKELGLAKKAREIIGDTSLTGKELADEYYVLAKEYDKLLRNAIKITSIGDVNQRKLLNAYHVEKEKLQLEQIVKDRTNEVEEKNRILEQQTELLKEQSRKLKEMAAIKSRFFANVSHEFRTPLTLIIGPLEQMLEFGNGENTEQLELMMRNAQRLLGLINQLLDLAKIESGSTKLQAYRQDCIPFIRGVVSSFQSLASQRGLDLSFFSHDDSIALYFDPVKLEEILYNLLINAIKYTPAGGNITVSVDSNTAPSSTFPTGSVGISIADTGHGIPAYQLENIFDRFFQADSANTSKCKGSGIGLAIVKELVNLHKGFIEAESLVDEGSTFIVRLPLGNTHLQPDEFSDSPPPTVTKKSNELRALFLSESRAIENAVGDDHPEKDIGKQTEEEEKNIILVVEDSADVRNYIKGALSDTYSVIEAENGQEGIQKARMLIPDLIISDIMMPETDGFELCRALKNDVKTSHIPIILLTSKVEDKDIIEGLETGADDYITKPFNTRILCSRIKNLIALRRHLQQTFDREMTLMPTKMAVSSLDKEFLDSVHDVLAKNISDPDFNVESLCEKLYMSRSTIYRKIQALSGESPTSYIRSYRLKRGAQLLKRHYGSVLEVSFEVGFSNSSYFTKCFKDKFQQLPSEYQKQNQ
jgi:signal transduction histidine kinase/CheY-like chemotaxis protein